MLIPLGTDRSLARPTLVTYWLIAANVAIFLLGAFWDRFDPHGHQALEELLALDPNHLRWYSFFTYQFLHAGIWHLGGNMLFLLVFGPNVEDRLGRAWFLAFYLASGIAAGAGHCLFERPIYEEEAFRILPSVVGASGAIAGVTGATIVLFPLTNVRVVSYFMVVGVFHVPAWGLIAFAITKDVFFQGLGAQNGVALVAHLAGYAWGISLCLTLLGTRVLAREPCDLFSLMRHAYRRRQFKELTSKGTSPWRADAAAVIAPVPAATPAEEQAQRRAEELRAQVLSAHGSGDLPRAADAYTRLFEATGEAVVHRDAQLDLANHFFAHAKYATALASYEAFLKRYPKDPQANHVRLMSALVNARYLNDPLRARALLRELQGAELEEPHRQLAQTLERELG